MPKFIKKFKLDQIEGLIAIIAITSLISFGILQYADMRLLESATNIRPQLRENPPSDEVSASTNDPSNVDEHAGEVTIQ